MAGEIQLKNTVPGKTGAEDKQSYIPRWGRYPLPQSVEYHERIISQTATRLYVGCRTFPTGTGIVMGVSIKWGLDVG